MGLNDINSLSHTRWNCKYHIVFAPKYRRKVFYKEKKAAIGKILRQLCEWKGVRIIEAEACPNHIHLFVEIPPKISVSHFMGYLKGKSSTMLYEQFGELKYKYRNREFWCRGYYVDTVGKNESRIAEYIPYGYTMRNGRTVIAQDEAAVIREIFSAYINGASLQSIAELLTERKIPYSERTDVWDKARIARIIGNAKYIGDGEYDPIIEEEQYEEAAAVKTARQRNTFEKNLEGLDLLRDLVRCAECGAPMRRRVSSKHRIRESWDCTNPDCGQRIRISDTHLLEKVTILMNRIIANSYLLIPRPKKRKELSAEAQRINREIDAELEQDDPSDTLIIVKTIEMAERLYAESDTHLQIAASIARKRVSLMTPQEEFSPAYFSDIAAYLTLGSGGKVVLHTKTDVEIGDEENECNQDTKENNISY